MLTRTSNDGMSTVEVTDDELRDMAALDVSAAVDVVTAHARARIDMSNRHAPLTAARDLLALAPAMAAELRAARAEIERLRTAAAEPAEDTPDEGRTVADDGRIRVVEHARNGETVAHVYVLGVRVNVTCRGQAVWIANALAPALEAATRPADDERADVVAYMSRVAANLRRQRPRTDYLDTEADTYERASDAIADECHVGAAKGANHG